MNESKITNYLATEIMRWKLKSIKWGDGRTFMCWIDKNGKITNYRKGEFRPMKSIVHAFAVQDEIAKMGSDVINSYARELDRIIMQGSVFKIMFKLINATAEQRSIAAALATATPEQLADMGLVVRT